jgi:type III pantothenate kinase
MTLIVDIGNSNIKIGVFYNDVVEKKWVISTNKSGDSEYYETEIRLGMENHGIKQGDISGAAISSVAPEITNAVKEALGFLGCKIILLNDQNTKIELKLTPEERKFRGTDIIADITAGLHKYGENFITIDFGTAIVISGVGKNGELLGVSILPSVPIIIDALISSCSQLAGFELKQRNEILGKTTVDALNGGVFWFVTEGIGGMVNKLKKEHGIKNVCFTGGLSKMFREYMNFESDFEENLTLDGIYQFFKLNAE